MKRILHFETRRQPLAARQVYSARLMRHAYWGLGVVAVWLAVGMAGYMFFEPMGLVDSFLNASMILSGMGPVDTQLSTGGAIFAGIYAIISGILIIGVAGLVLAPVFHRLLHKFHVDDK
jgi:hypothetical protein